MSKTKIFLLTIFTLSLLACSNLHQKSSQNNITKYEVQDSIRKILITISDKWRYTSQSDIIEKRIVPAELDEITIQHWIDTKTEEPVNEISFSGMKLKYADSTNRMQGWSLDEKVTVVEKDSKFGLKRVKSSEDDFIEITELNDSVLRLNNGEHFKRLPSYVR